MSEVVAIKNGEVLRLHLVDESRCTNGVKVYPINSNSFAVNTFQVRDGRKRRSIYLYHVNFTTNLIGMTRVKKITIAGTLSDDITNISGFSHDIEAGIYSLTSVTGKTLRSFRVEHPDENGFVQLTEIKVD